MRPDVLFASGTPELAMLREKTRLLPIVFVLVSDPVKLGFVTSLARPGGNITGFANFEHPIGGKWLDLLKDTAPGRNRIAVVLRPDNPSQMHIGTRSRLLPRHSEYNWFAPRCVMLVISSMPLLHSRNSRMVR